MGVDAQDEGEENTSGVDASMVENGDGNMWFVRFAWTLKGNFWLWNTADWPDVDRHGGRVP